MEKDLRRGALEDFRHLLLTAQRESYRNDKIAGAKRRDTFCQFGYMQDLNYKNKSSGAKRRGDFDHCVAKYIGNPMGITRSRREAPDEFCQFGANTKAILWE